MPDQLTRLKVPTPHNGIVWHTLRYGTGPDLILLPSGEGDTHTFAGILHQLARHFTLTTFDMPGFSRTTCPPEALENLSASKLATQIVGLMDALEIPRASFFGCGSGGLVALTLAAEYSERVMGVVVHEVPLLTTNGLKSGFPGGDLASLKRLGDAEAVEACREMFLRQMCEDESKWEGLPGDLAGYHKRQESNYVTWVRHYVGKIERRFEKQDLTKRPITWTVGGLTPAGMFWGTCLHDLRLQRAGLLTLRISRGCCPRLWCWDSGRLAALQAFSPCDGTGGVGGAYQKSCGRSYASHQWRRSVR